MSRTIGITGAAGLLGWHAAAFVRSFPEVTLKLATRETFETPALLAEFVRDCSSIWHFAGMNRGEESVVAQTNVLLANQLIAALETAGSAAHVLFSSSTHIDRDTAYGASKRQVAENLDAWAGRSGGAFSNVVLPNVFGESGKPFYNSVVSTFCHQITCGETPTIQQDAELNQLHSQAVARIFWDATRQKLLGELRPNGQRIHVSGLLEKIRGFHELYQHHIFPDVREDFDRDLFNTYRSYLYPQRYPTPLTLHSDARGSLFESVKTHNGGQTFLSTTNPGITRGNHYHTRKIERFLVVAGEAEIRVRKVLGNETQVFRVSGQTPAYVDIPTLHTHNITNVGNGELITLFWTHEFYNPDLPDTVMEAV
jgi:UDP-2-acetamido-2,6-beta-L-arabino-hexul-4-ose reductase